MKDILFTGLPDADQVFLANWNEFTPMVLEDIDRWAKRVSARGPKQIILRIGLSSLLRKTPKSSEDYPVEELEGLLPDGGIKTPLGYFIFIQKIAEVQKLEASVNGGYKEQTEDEQLLKEFKQSLPKELNTSHLSYGLDFANISAIKSYSNTLGVLARRLRGENSIAARQTSKIESRTEDLVSMFHLYEEASLDVGNHSRPAMTLIRARTRHALANWFESRETKYFSIAMEEMSHIRDTKL